LSDGFEDFFIPGYRSDNPPPSPEPEPVTVALLGLGMVALTFTRRKLRKYTKPFLAKKTRNIPEMFRVFLIYHTAITYDFRSATLRCYFFSAGRITAMATPGRGAFLGCKF